jgi:hypothetical protein
MYDLKFIGSERSNRAGFRTRRPQRGARAHRIWDPHDDGPDVARPRTVSETRQRGGEPPARCGSGIFGSIALLWFLKT